MKLDDLKKLESSISTHAYRAKKLKEQMESVASMRKAEGLIVRIGENNRYENGLTTNRELNDYVKNPLAKDEAFKAIWEKCGHGILRQVEMDLAAQVRAEEIAADILQGQLDRYLAAAAALNETIQNEATA